MRSWHWDETQRTATEGPMVVVRGGRNTGCNSHSSYCTLPGPCVTCCTSCRSSVLQDQTCNNFAASVTKQSKRGFICNEPDNLARKEARRNQQLITHHRLSYRQYDTRHAAPPRRGARFRKQPASLTNTVSAKRLRPDGHFLRRLRVTSAVAVWAGYRSAPPP